MDRSRARGGLRIRGGSAPHAPVGVGAGRGWAAPDRRRLGRRFADGRGDGRVRPAQRVRRAGSCVADQLRRLPPRPSRTAARLAPGRTGGMSATGSAPRPTSSGPASRSTSGTSSHSRHSFSAPSSVWYGAFNRRMQVGPHASRVCSVLNAQICAQPRVKPSSSRHTTSASWPVLALRMPQSRTGAVRSGVDA